MKNIGIFLLFFLLMSACTQVSEEPTLEEEAPEIITERPRICSDEWEVLSGDFDLFRTWTFIGFEHTSSKVFSQLTCLAKVADFALNGEKIENMRPIELTFLHEKSCQINAFEIPWVASSIGFGYAGCMNDTATGILVWEDSNRRTLLENPARNTLPVLEFDAQFIRGITGATVYRITANRLYLYGGLENMVMVFGTSN